MTEPTSPKKKSLGWLGIGAAACVGCCAGPILAFLGGVGLIGAASTTVIGSAGLLIAAAAWMVLLVVRRRRRASSCAVSPVEPVPVATPTPKATIT